MIYDFQKAGSLKRISAFILDIIIVSILATGAMWGISAVSGYEKYSNDYEKALKKYENEYGIDFDVYEELSEEESKAYYEAFEALSKDEKAMSDYEMTVNLTFLMTSLGLFIGVLLGDFVIPLFFGNGQTVGKKIFGLIVIRTDSVKATNPQLFIRAMMGKYTIELMVPVFLVVMFWFGIVDVFFGLAVPGIIAAAQLILFFSTKERTLIHDKFSGTAVADKATQMIFATSEELVEYKKKLHAEKASREEYL